MMIDFQHRTSNSTTQGVGVRYGSLRSMSFQSAGVGRTTGYIISSQKVLILLSEFIELDTLNTHKIYFTNFCNLSSLYVSGQDFLHNTTFSFMCIWLYQVELSFTVGTVVLQITTGRRIRVWRSLKRLYNSKYMNKKRVCKKPFSQFNPLYIWYHQVQVVASLI